MPLISATLSQIVSVLNVTVYALPKYQPMLVWVVVWRVFHEFLCCPILFCAICWSNWWYQFCSLFGTMKSLHVLIVPWLSSLYEPVVLQTPPHTMLYSCNTVGDYLPLPPSYIFHLVYKNRFCEHQKMHGVNSPLCVRYVYSYQVPVVTSVANLGRQSHNGVLACIMHQWTRWHSSNLQMIWI